MKNESLGEGSLDQDTRDIPTSTGTTPPSLPVTSSKDLAPNSAVAASESKQFNKSIGSSSSSTVSSTTTATGGVTSSTSSKREELLKQLKAVEDAIARKRAKLQ